MRHDQYVDSDCGEWYIGMITLSDSEPVAEVHSDFEPCHIKSARAQNMLETQRWYGAGSVQKVCDQSSAIDPTILMSETVICLDSTFIRSDN